MMKRYASLLVVAVTAMPLTASAASIGYADVVLDYFDSGAGPLAGPYGGDGSGAFPIGVSTDVVLGDDPVSGADFLSLPTGSYVTVGFTDETVIDGAGDDIFIREIGVGGETAEVLVSSDGIDFFSLGIANDATTTSFDLADISFGEPVQAIRIVGLDNFGGSPGFDVVNAQVLPGSIGAPVAPVPVPASIWLFGSGVLFLMKRLYSKRRLGGGIGSDQRSEPLHRY